jgi:hypothetical protein
MFPRISAIIGICCIAFVIAILIYDYNYPDFEGFVKLSAESSVGEFIYIEVDYISEATRIGRGRSSDHYVYFARSKGVFFPIVVSGGWNNRDFEKYIDDSTGILTLEGRLWHYNHIGVVNDFIRNSPPETIMYPYQLTITTGTSSLGDIIAGWVLLLSLLTLGIVLFIAGARYSLIVK